MTTATGSTGVLRRQEPEKDDRFFIVGGAGFIGSHFTDALLADPDIRAITLYDNFSSGREWHYAHHAGNARLKVVKGDVKDLAALQAAMEGHGTVIHLASNPDIARATVEPSIDFYEGTFLTHQVVEAMRLSGARHILYSAGSGVYGDRGTAEAHEDDGSLLPVSTYGASKLAGEALISAYCHMYGFTACAFRFGNVVGPRQTHGVGLDFVRRLLHDPKRLQILGDGKQSKSYIHVSDVVRSVLFAREHTREAFRAYNVATGDYSTVTEIAELAAECVGLDPRSVEFTYTGGDRGWKGDVPVVRLNTDRIKALGWTCQMNSKEALRASMRSLLEDIKAGNIV